MKASELIKILEAHPDWDVVFEDRYFGGIDCEMEALDIKARTKDPFGNVSETWLISTPYQGEEPE